jgi:hypothetical protein
MKPDDKQAPPETGLTVWRRVYAQLRGLERKLVEASRAGQDASRLEGLYREIEALRQETTELFAAAQLESVSKHVELFRASAAVARGPNQTETKAPVATSSEDAERDGSAGQLRTTALQRARRGAGAVSASKPLAVRPVGARCPN